MIRDKDEEIFELTRQLNATVGIQTKPEVQVCCRDPACFPLTLKRLRCTGGGALRQVAILRCHRSFENKLFERLRFLLSQKSPTSV